MIELSNIDACEHPKRIINPYTDEVQYVPCRKCASCLNKRSLEWSRRLESECKFHRYSMFVTLTYDNAHLPVLTPVYNEDGSIREWHSNRDYDNSQVIKHEERYRPIRIQNSDVIGVAHVCKSDVVKFFKRLRSNIHYHFKQNNINESEKIRYFICSEYGSRTLRPHYHFILWFDSETICREFGRFLSKSWTLGRKDFSLVNSSAPQYVAKYLNGNDSLPGILQAQPTHTFHLASKKPLIGFGVADEEALFENVLNGTFGHLELDERKQVLVHVPSSRQVEMRYIPKCRGYRRISHSEKLRVYSYVYDIVTAYGKEILHSATSSYFESAVDLHASMACYRWCEKYHWTPEIYVSAVEDYYSKKELYQLYKQYEYQKSYIEEYNLPIQHLIGQDPTIYEQLPRTGFEFIGSHLSRIFLNYDIHYSDVYDDDGCIDGFKVESLKQRHSDFYKRNVALHQKIHQDSMKSKVKNEIINPNIFV